MAEAQGNDQNAVWSRNLTDRALVWRIFKDFRDREDPVTLRFESVDTVYTARVREVDHRRVTLDAIHPRSGEVLMSAGRPFALAGRSDGAHIHAPRNRSNGVVPDGAGTAFLMDLPDQLISQQRRRGPRLQMPAALRGGRARILLTHDGVVLTGSIEDISVGGCRATFERSAQDLLAGKDVFDHVRLEIGGLLSVQVRVAVRHRMADPATGSVTFGLEFTRIATVDRGRLEQFVRSLARRGSQG